MSLLRSELIRELPRKLRASDDVPSNKAQKGILSFPRGDSRNDKFMAGCFVSRASRRLNMK